VIYELRHLTTYRYQRPVNFTRCALRLSPADTACQHLLHNEIHITPSPLTTAARKGAFVCLSVQDAGYGIPPELLARIFEPFFTTKEIGKGTGLGLATVHSIVQQHDGWLEVLSQPGTGSIFKVFLPISLEAQEAGAAPSPNLRVPCGQETILLVEDDASVRTLIGNYLRGLGYQIIEAVDGIQALEAWPALRDRTDLLLTDMVMPRGITGKDLALALMCEKPSLKVIYLSGYSSELTLDLALEEGLNYLPKPFAPPTLAKTIRRCLDSR